MSKHDVILGLQAFLIFLQLVNASLITITKNPVITVFLAAFIGALQFFLQNYGNKMEPPVGPPSITSEK